MENTLFFVDRQKCGNMDMKELIVAFKNVSRMPLKVA
jgi:hypothetical protein